MPKLNLTTGSPELTQTALVEGKKTSITVFGNRDVAVSLSMKDGDNNDIPLDVISKSGGVTVDILHGTTVKAILLTGTAATVNIVQAT